MLPCATSSDLASAITADRHTFIPANFSSQLRHASEHQTFYLHCRSVVERLSTPGVRRLFVVDPDTRRMEGIVSLSDVAAYLFDVF